MNRIIISLLTGMALVSGYGARQTVQLIILLTVMVLVSGCGARQTVQQPTPLPSGISATPDPARTALIDQALRLHEAGDYTTAITTFFQAAEGADPDLRRKCLEAAARTALKLGDRTQFRARGDDLETEFSSPFERSLPPAAYIETVTLNRLGRGEPAPKNAPPALKTLADTMKGDQ